MKLNEIYCAAIKHRIAHMGPIVQALYTDIMQAAQSHYRLPWVVIGGRASLSRDHADEFTMLDFSKNYCGHFANWSQASYQETGDLVRINSIFAVWKQHPRHDEFIGLLNKYYSLVDRFCQRGCS